MVSKAGDTALPLARVRGTVWRWVPPAQGGHPACSQSSGKQREEKAWFQPGGTENTSATIGFHPEPPQLPVPGVSAATSLQWDMPLGEHPAPSRVNN